MIGGIFIGVMIVNGFDARLVQFSSQYSCVCDSFRMMLLERRWRI